MINDLKTWTLGIGLSVILTIVIVNTFFLTEEPKKSLPESCNIVYNLFRDPEANITYFSVNNEYLFCIDNALFVENRIVCLDKEGDLISGFRIFKPTEDARECVQRIYKALMKVLTKDRK